MQVYREGQDGPRLQTVSARLNGYVVLEAHPDGKVNAHFGDHSIGLGTFGARMADRVQLLSTGLPLASFASTSRPGDKKIYALVQQLARQGLLEYRVAGPRGDDQAVIEPQGFDYWPAAPALKDADVLVLSRFAYMRRRGNELVLELPRAGALFRICDPKIAATIAALSMPAVTRPISPAERFPWTRASRSAGGLPDPLADRRSRSRPAIGRGRRQSCPLGLSRSAVSCA